MATTKTINRVTLFKIPEIADQQRLLEIYKEMPSKAKKDGRPYILSVSAGQTFEDQRRQGFTVAVFSVFASVEDMNYYDNTCQAHAQLKEFAKSVHKGVLMVFYENSLL